LLRGHFYGDAEGGSGMSARREGFAVWTSVETALPDEELIVLFALDDREVWLGCLTDDGWIEMNGEPIDANRVTHWMHMPAHPAELEDK
jgi:hypothetical protein